MMMAGILVTAGTLHAQPALGPPTLPADLQLPPPLERAPKNPIIDPEVKQASGCCATPAGSGASSYGCSGNNCVPGRQCTGCNSDTLVGRLLGGFYDALCCPDPCYEPRWLPTANAAFFQDSPRPVTQTRLKWDSVFHYGFPDSAEYFWGQIGTKGPKNPAPSLRYNSLSLYQEVAAKGASVFVEVPYFSITPDNNPSQAGFGDISTGVKTVLLDRELLLVSTQMKVIAPAGVFTSGLGTGHVSLEPSLMAALKLSPSTHLQMQFADWIPLGGTPGFAGQTLHYHLSLNQNLCHQGDCLNIVGTMEFNGFSYRGQFTDALGNHVDLSGSNYYNAGPGLRMQFCDRVDLGFGAAFGFGNGHGPGQIYRTEFRLRF
jgi:Putative MetA-pathway of phenol degradation